MEAEVLFKQISFIHEIDKLKYVMRKSKLFSSDRRENDAEHSWHLAMMAVILVRYSDEPVDLLKVLKMLLIHDLPEIDAGDVFLFDTAARSESATAEATAARRIFGLLPAEQGEALFSLWQEFVEGKTPEARFANAMDRLAPVLQNVSNGGGSWREFNVDQDKVMDKNSLIREGSTVLWTYAQDLIRQHFESCPADQFNVKPGYDEQNTNVL